MTSEGKKTVAFVLGIITVLYLLVVCPASCMLKYDIDKNTDAFARKAMQTATVPEMLSYLKAYKGGLELQCTNGSYLVTGHTAMVFKRADNSVRGHLRTLDELKLRLYKAKDNNAMSAIQYKLLLDDARKIIKPISKLGASYWYVTYGFWLALIAAILIVLTTFFSFWHFYSECCYNWSEGVGLFFLGILLDTVLVALAAAAIIC